MYSKGKKNCPGLNKVKQKKKSQHHGMIRHIIVLFLKDYFRFTFSLCIQNDFTCSSGLQSSMLPGIYTKTYIRSLDAYNAVAFWHFQAMMHLQLQHCGHCRHRKLRRCPARLFHIVFSTLKNFTRLNGSIIDNSWAITWSSYLELVTE